MSGNARQPLLMLEMGTPGQGHFSSGACAAQALLSNASRANASGREDLCPVCISDFNGPAPTYQLSCGHRFHSLCIASCLQACQLCPMCRVPVTDDTCTDLAQALLAGGTSSALALELLMDLNSRGRARLDGEVYDDEIIDAIRRAAQKGDASKIPSIAIFLGKGPGGNRQSPEVRAAACEGLRALVPAFASTWPGLQEVLTLLRTQCLEDNDKEVRVAALRALREVSPKGKEIDIMTVRRVLEDPTSDSDLRQEATDTLRVLAEKNDPKSSRTALAALLDKDAGVRTVALSTLRSLCSKGSSESKMMLAELAKLAVRHSEAEVRCAALELIGYAEVSGGSLGIAAANMALRDPEEDVRVAALATLKRLWTRSSPGALDTLRALLLPNGEGCQNREESQVRIEAARMLPRLASRPNKMAALIAVAALSDVDDSVRLEAASALKQVSDRGDEEVRDRLLTLLGHSDTEVQRLAVESLGVVAARQDATVRSALIKLSENPNSDLQMVAQGALRQLG